MRHPVSRDSLRNPPAQTAETAPPGESEFRSLFLRVAPPGTFTTAATANHIAGLQIVLEAAQESLKTPRQRVFGQPWVTSTRGSPARRGERFSPARLRPALGHQHGRQSSCQTLGHDTRLWRWEPGAIFHLLFWIRGQDRTPSPAFSNGSHRLAFLRGTGRPAGCHSN